MYFFTADFHFGNSDIIEREARPFKDMKEMEDVIVNNINSEASKDDTLFVLGDWINYSTIYHSDISVFEVCRRINPSVVLIMGNGEQRFMKDVFNGDFEKMRRELKEMGIAEVLWDYDVEFGGETFHLIHRPEDRKEGCLNLFGHTHRSTGLWKPFGLNVGTDLNHFRPFSGTEILRLLETKRRWWDNDASVKCL